LGLKPTIEKGSAAFASLFYCSNANLFSFDTMKPTEPFSWKKRGRSFQFAFKGIAYFFQSQHNTWIHSGCAVLAIGCGFFFELNSMEWLWIVLAIGLVFFAEMVNTAIELVVDLVSPDYNELAGKAKDVAAGSVLVSAIAAAIIGLIIFIPKGMEVWASTF